MNIKMLKDREGSLDGQTAVTFAAGKTYELTGPHAEFVGQCFVASGDAKEVNTPADANPDTPVANDQPAGNSTAVENATAATGDAATTAPAKGGK